MGTCTRKSTFADVEWGRQPLAIDHCLFVFSLGGTREDKSNSGRVVRYDRFPEVHSK